MSKRKQKGGRPVQGKEVKQRHQVMLEPSVAALLRIYGDNNLSRGIAVAVGLCESYGVFASERDKRARLPKKLYSPVNQEVTRK